MENKAMMMMMMLVFALLLVLFHQLAYANDDDQTLDGCRSSCGDVQITYPFGVGNSSIPGKTCFLEKPFELACNTSTSTLYWGNSSNSDTNIPVIAMNISQNQVDMMMFVTKLCHNSTFGTNGTMSYLNYLIGLPSFSISRKDNKFISVGCDNYGYLYSYFDGNNYTTGCTTSCYGDRVSSRFVDGDCSGNGCCEVDIPPGLRNVFTRTFSFENFNKTLSYNNCSYSFVVKNGNYTFSQDHLKNMPFKKVPVVFDWTVGDETCEVSRRSGRYVCQRNSICTNNDYGYQCHCNKGYEGNPYHPIGCRDIDECKRGNHNCMSADNCRNKNGYYECFCPKGQFGNGTKEDSCHQKNTFNKIFIGASAGFFIFFVAISSLYLIYQKRKLIKLKEKLFAQNGGYILLQQLSAREESCQTAQIFTSSELKKATNNYDEKLIIGKGGYGTVFKGFLADNRIVAIKKSKIVDESQTEQFINEVIVLSQINHRNVVKLLGCCLETEVPLLVYEFVNNGTLFDFIHNVSGENSSSWETRLRIAIEAAGALSYLHSAASIPIIHRDVKSANILLDDTYTVKVSDFGASRFVPLDQTELATMVQGTIGYLDPEYMQTSHLTEKSDVYSFGVVLVELLTSKKPFSFDKTKENGGLAMYFLSCMKEDRLFEVVQDGILNEENEQGIREVAILAAKCLRLIGEERPSMKEVAMELERIRLMQKNHWTNSHKNLEETPYLLPKSSLKMYEHGDSSSSYPNGGYDTIRDQVVVAFDDGR